MSESERPLDTESKPPAHDDPLVHDDLLSPTPEPAPRAEPAPSPEEPAAAQPAGDVPAPAPPRDAVRRLVPIGWALVAVIIIAAVLMVLALQRISSEVSKVNCVVRAQASYAGSTGATVESANTRLARLGLQVALRKCGS